MENNLNLYYVFYTVAKCGNISTAASRLFISQPAISKSISKLEQNLEVTLFHRSSRGVSLTQEGELLCQQAETAFTAIRQGEEQLRRMSELGIGHLSIGASATLCRYVLLPYLKNFIQTHPHIKISISCQSSSQTICDLENRSLDIGLIGGPIRTGKLHFCPLKEIQDIFVTTKSYLNNLRKRMDIGHSRSSLSVYSQATLILLDKDNLTRQYVDAYLSRDLVENDRLIEVTTMDLLIELAKIDLGVACVISDFVKKELADGILIRLKPPAVIPKRKIGFAFHENNVSNEAVNEFLECIRHCSF